VKTQKDYDSYHTFSLSTWKQEPFPLTHALLNQEAKETALREMPAPTGYRRSVVPPKTEGRSCVYDHGVRFEQDCTNPDDIKMR